MYLFLACCINTAIQIGFKNQFGKQYRKGFFFLTCYLVLSWQKASTRAGHKQSRRVTETWGGWGGSATEERGRGSKVTQGQRSEKCYKMLSNDYSSLQSLTVFNFWLLLSVFINKLNNNDNNVKTTTIT